MVAGIGVVDDERRLGAHTLHEVDLTGVDVALVFVGIVLIANGDSGQRGTLLAQVGDDGTSVNTGDSRDALTSAPLGKALDSGPVAVFLSHISNDNAGALDVGRLEVLEEVVLVALIRRHAVVANEGLGENQDLAAVRGIRHGLGVTHERGGEDSLAGDVDVGAKGLAVKHGTILWTTGQQQTPGGMALGQEQKQEHTLMVNVAFTPDAGAVVRVLVAGIVLPLLPLTVSLLAKRVWLGRRAAWPMALKGRRAARRENMVTEVIRRRERGRRGSRVAQNAS